MEPVEWTHCLITLNTIVMRPRPNFYDENGYDIHPLNRISIVDSTEKETPISNLLVDEVSIEDVPIEPTSPSKKNSKLNLESSNEEDWEVPEEELDKVWLIIKQHREALNISITPERKQRHLCKSHQKLRNRCANKKKRKRLMITKKEELSLP